MKLEKTEQNEEHRRQTQQTKLRLIHGDDQPLTVTIEPDTAASVEALLTLFQVKKVRNLRTV